MNKTLFLTFVSLLPACFDPMMPPDAGTTGSGNDDDQTSSTGEADSDSGSTTSGAPEPGSTSELESSSSTGPGPVSDPGSTADGRDSGSLPDGESCEANDECESGACYSAGVLGGVCGECLSDDDCAWGCRPPTVLSSTPEGSRCDDGSLRAACESDAACQGGFTCKEIVDIPGVMTVNGCSECASDLDCDGDRCSPNYGDLFPGFVGYWRCVGEGSQPLGSGCWRLDDADPTCTSGLCAAGDLMGLVEIGICSECVQHSDCTTGRCDAPEIELDGTVIPGRCV